MAQTFHDLSCYALHTASADPGGAPRRGGTAAVELAATGDDVRNQLTWPRWHEQIGDAATAGGVLDRFAHSANASSCAGNLLHAEDES